MFVAAALMLFEGCTPVSLFPRTPRYMREHGYPFSDAWQPPSPGEVPQEEADAPAHIFITALRGGSFVLFRDGEEIASAPAGDNPDLDRHRQMGGHLWTDELQGKETVVFRDGEEWLRFHGEELFAGFLLRDGDLHTLGQRPGDQGLCYRINGKEVFADAPGRILGSSRDRDWEGGALCADASGVYFCYGIPIRHSGSTSWEYRIMKGAETIGTIADDDAGVVLDIRIVDGKVYRIERRGDELYFVSPRGAFPLGDASGVALVRIGDHVCVRGHNSAGTACWYKFNSKTLAWRSCTELLYDGTSEAWWTETDGRIAQMQVGKTALDIDPGRYSLSTPLCANFFGPTLAAVLTDNDGYENLIVTDTTVTPFYINGTITSISLE